jgi:hypothetical protein
MAPSASEAVSRLTKISGKRDSLGRHTRYNLSEKKRRKNVFVISRMGNYPIKWATQNRDAGFGRRRSSLETISGAEDSSERNKNFPEAKRRLTKLTRKHRRKRRLRKGAKFLLLVAREADGWALLPRKARTCIWRPDHRDFRIATAGRSLARSRAFTVGSSD